MKSWDIIITGAGIIGVSLALELRQRGASVLVMERGEPGGESSSAAAGMLAPADPDTPAALRTIASASAQLFPEYVEKLESLAGMEVDFRRQGTIAFLETADGPPEYQPLSSAQLHHREPALVSPGHPSFFVQENSVDPRLLMRAALTAAQKSGVEIYGNSEVRAISIQNANPEVRTDRETFSARAVINCQGAWSGAPVRPRKGQMFYVQPQRARLLQHVMRAPDVYIVPRSSGKILIGATVEDVGYDKTVDDSAIHGLLTAGTKYLPELASATIIERWAGLRPGTPDSLPIIVMTGKRNVFVASGHFRNGILLAPITAKIMAYLAAGKTPAMDIATFSPNRFAAEKPSYADHAETFGTPAQSVKK